MGSYYPGTISVGGEVTEAVAARLEELVICAGLNIGDWMGEPLVAGELMTQLRRGTLDGPLSCYDAGACCGQFETLEAWCREAGLTYVRHSDPYDQDAGEYVWWRPGMEQPGWSYASAEGTLLVAHDEVEETLAAGPDALAAYLAEHKPVAVPPLKLAVSVSKP